MAATPKDEFRRVGLDLLARGCVQGAVFEIAIAPVRWRRSGTGGDPWEAGVDPRRPEALVVASQDCDIAAPPTKEPAVEALAADWITDPGLIHQAEKGNSARSFLLHKASAGRALVADATRRIEIEKPSLLEIEFRDVLAPDDRDRFARWLGSRFDRPALPDVVVDHIAKPIIKGIEKLRKDGDLLVKALDQIEELRLAIPTGDPPWSLCFLARIDSPESLKEVDKNELQGWFEETLTAALGDLGLRVDFKSADEISLTEYIATVRLALDHFSFGSAG